MQVNEWTGHFTWNVLHYRCMILHFGIHHSGMGPIQIGNFYPYNLYEKRRKKIDFKWEMLLHGMEKKMYMLIQQYSRVY